MKFLFGFSMIISLLLVLGGVVVIFVFPIILRHELQLQLALNNGSTSYPDWKDPPFPIYMQFFFFNVTNPLEVQQGKKPALLQHGPYSYREHKPKVDITFNSNHTVTYRSPTYYVFDQQTSAGDETDMFTILNVPFATLMAMINKELHSLPKSIRDTALEVLSGVAKRLNEDTFTVKSVDEILWGYDDPFFKDISTIVHDINKILEIFGRNISIPLPAKFGLFYGQNNTDDGLWTIYTGSDDINKFTEIDHWNGVNELEYWTTQSCNAINGTDGTTFPPYVDKEKPLFMYVTDMCRSLHISYEHDTAVHGVSAYKFTAPEDLFVNASVNPGNAGFCNPCVGNGVLDMSSCKQGAPVFLSAPNFYMADEQFVDAVIGLKPVKEEHETFMTIEPTVGLILQAAKRMQLNLQVNKTESVKAFAGVNDVLFPIVWLNESFLLDAPSAEKLKNQILEPVKAVHIGQYVAIAVGAFMLIILGSNKLLKSRKARRDDEQPVLQKENENPESINR